MPPKKIATEGDEVGSRDKQYSEIDLKMRVFWKLVVTCSYSDQYPTSFAKYEDIMTMVVM